MEMEQGNIVYIMGIENEETNHLANSLNSRVYYIRKKIGFIPNIITGRNISKAVNEIALQNPESEIILICHCPAVIGMFGRCPKNTFVVFHGHVYSDEKLFVRFFYKVLFKKIGRKCTFISCSNECARYYQRVFNINSHAIQNGVDVVAKKHVLDKGTFKIGFVGVLNNHKGYKYLLEAVKYLSNVSQNVKIVLVGENVDNFDFSTLTNQNSNCSVEYLGVVDNVKAIMSDLFDILIMPSLMEGIPISLLEAMSLNIPILATKVGGIPEILYDGYNGFFIERNAENIAEKVLQCMDADKYKLLQDGCEDIYNKNYRCEIMYNKYEKLFCGVNLNTINPQKQRSVTE
ncbi:MAG: glycosyltransferase family 4 protein, partial [Clostridiales bacterium]|nr:glycosyltransferase family 4 protein [Candidatus Equinaster intestinalis]